MVTYERRVSRPVCPLHFMPTDGTVRAMGDRRVGVTGWSCGWRHVGLTGCAFWPDLKPARWYCGLAPYSLPSPCDPPSRATAFAFSLVLYKHVYQTNKRVPGCVCLQVYVCCSTCGSLATTCILLTVIAPCCAATLGDFSNCAPCACAMVRCGLGSGVILVHASTAAAPAAANKVSGSRRGRLAALSSLLPGRATCTIWPSG